MCSSGRSFQMKCRWLLSCLTFLSVSLAQAQPSTDLETYVLFAGKQIFFKGGQGADTGFIRGGNIGVNQDNADPSAREYSTSNGHVFHIVPTGYTGGQLVSESIAIGKGSILTDLYSNRQFGDFTQSMVKGVGPIATTFPIIAQFPTFPSFPSSADLEPLQGFQVAGGTTVNIAPGSYSSLDIMENGTVNLQKGVYHFLYLTASDASKLNIEEGTIIHIAQYMSVNKCRVGNSDASKHPELARFYVRGDADGRGGNSNNIKVGFGRSSEFWGKVYLNSGNLALGHSALLHGSFWTKESMHSDWNDNIWFGGSESVSGTKYLDKDGDRALSAADKSWAGVTIYVDYNDNGLLDAGEPSTVTSATGYWQIKNIKTGTYHVREVGVSGYRCSVPVLLSANAAGCSTTTKIVFAGTGINHDAGAFLNSEITYCELNPSAPECNQVDCTKTPTAPECLPFCVKYPEDPTCKQTCEQNPDQSECVLDCTKTPNDPRCLANCTQNPTDPRCLVDCTATPNDPACVLDCSKTPTDPRCTPLCELNPAAPECQLDCTKTPSDPRCTPFCVLNPTAPECTTCQSSDLCGVCNGANSCLGCEVENIGDKLAALDGGAIKQDALVQRLLSQLGKKKKSASIVKYIAKTRALAKDLHIKNWTLVWTRIPTEDQTCTNKTLCTSYSNTPALEEYRARSEQLRKLAYSVVKKLNGKKKLSSEIKKLLKKANALHAENLSMSDTVPLSYEVCGG